MKVEVTVRRATRADAAKVAEFAVELFKLHEQWDPKRFTQLATIEGGTRYYGDRAAAENATVLVAEIDGSMIGFAYMEYEPILYAELATRVAWLHDIYIEPETRGSGAGKALLKEVSSEARRLGANKILLTAAIANEAGREYFERSGFKTTMVEMMLDLEDRGSARPLTE